MCPKPIPRTQTGAGLPIAIFIITVLALLVIGMAQLQESSGKSVSLQIQSQRAFFAAESGAQVALSELLSQGDSSLLSCGAAPVGTVDYEAGGLSSCFSEISCSEIGGVSGSLLITSSGTCGTGTDGAERAVEVRLR
jgi:MSHA biogenesis protein MshP